MTVEETLIELFNLIPPRTWAGGTTPKPKYHFGDGIEANKFIKESKNDVYPLIYQTSIEETETAKYIETNLELVLAVQNLKTELFNTQRWATSYRNVLVPLKEDVQRCFEKSMAIMPAVTGDGGNSTFNYTIIKRPNYSETDSKDANAFIDIVDAIVMRVRIRILRGVCINKKIYFNR